MKVNKEIAYEAYKDFYGGKKLNENQKLLVDDMIDSKIKSIENSHEIVNGISRGDNNAIKKLNNYYGGAFESNTKKLTSKQVKNLQKLYPEGDIGKDIF